MMLYVVHALDKLNIGDARKHAFDSHIDHFNRADQYLVTIILAGPLFASDASTPIGSLLILEAMSQIDVQNFVAENSFSTGGVWGKVTISPFKRGRGIEITLAV